MRARTRSKQMGYRTLIMHFYHLQPKLDTKLARCISLIPHVMYGKRRMKKNNKRVQNYLSVILQ